MYTHLPSNLCTPSEQASRGRMWRPGKDAGVQNGLIWFSHQHANYASREPEHGRLNVLCWNLFPIEHGRWELTTRPPPLVTTMLLDTSFNTYIL